MDCLCKQSVSRQFHRKILRKHWTEFLETFVKPQTRIMLKTPVRALKSHEGAVHVVQYNISGQYFLSGGQDREIHLFNPNTGSKIKSYVAHGRAPIVVQSEADKPVTGWEVLDITVSADNAKFASVGGDKAV